MQIKIKKETFKSKEYIKKSKVFTYEQSEKLYKVLKLAYENNFTFSEIYNFFYNAVKIGLDIDTAIAEFEVFIKKKVEATTSRFSHIGNVIEIILSNLKNSIL